MSEEKFTRGPWVARPEECDKPYIRIRGTELGGRFKIANVLTPVYEGVHEREAIETRANAHLIAAAPELLDALTKMIHAVAGVQVGDEPSVYADYDRLCELVKGARAAIIKARGQS